MTLCQQLLRWSVHPYTLGYLPAPKLCRYFYLPISHLPTSRQLPFCPSQDRCNIINTTLGFLTQKVKLETFNTILIGLLMKNSNNLRITGVMLPLGKVKVARHSTYSLFLFFSLHYSILPDLNLLFLI